MTRYTDKDGKPVRLKKDGSPDRRSPPEEHQFKKGKSGNPSGRPKGKASVEKAVQKALSKMASVRLGGDETEMPMLEAMVLALAHRGVKGDSRAFAELIKHLPEDRRLAATPEEEAARRKALASLMDMIDRIQQLRFAGVMANIEDRTFVARWIYEEYVRRENEGIGHGPIDVDVHEFDRAKRKS